MHDVEIIVRGPAGSGKTALTAEIIVALQRFGINLIVDESITIDGDLFRGTIVEQFERLFAVTANCNITIKNENVNRAID
jgi:Ni2+-binding GTPase involved in maturation of urease and hydrogenase